MESLDHWTIKEVPWAFFFFPPKQEVDHERSDIMRFTFSQNFLEVQVRQHLTKSFLNPHTVLPNKGSHMSLRNAGYVLLSDSVSD